MPAFLSKPANVLTVTLIAIVSALLAYLGATTLIKPAARPSSSTTVFFTAPTAAELRAALSLSGLSAKPLAAAGVQEGQVGTVVSNARTYLTNSNAAFQSAVANFRDSSLLVETLENKARTGQASEQDLTALASARTSLAGAVTARDSAIAALFAAGTANLSESAVAALTNIRANRDRPVPIQYQVATRTDADWLILRDALANDRISARFGQDPDDACHQTVLDANAETAVNTAASGLANLPTIAGTYNAATGQ